MNNSRDEAAYFESSSADNPGDMEARISNEFAEVVVRKVYTRNGERLEILAPDSGNYIRLDPLELEAITWQDHDVFSRLLRGSVGPPEGSGELP